MPDLDADRSDTKNTDSAAFFLVVPPGLEEVVARELRSLNKEELQIQVVRGGLELSSVPLAAVMEWNRRLKTPSRILLRLDQFGCRDFPKLFKKLQKIDWRTWMPAGLPDLDVSTHNSRLRIKKRIEETGRDALRRYWRDQGVDAKEGNGLHVFVRIQDDVCTVSLDTSGEHLHRRGWRHLTSEAPIRENLAAAVLLQLREDSRRDASPAPASSVRLVDPMCGSGTFLIEALTLDQPARSRAFAFERIPAFSSYLGSASGSLSGSANPIGRVLGWDVDANALDLARENARAAGIQPSDLEVLTQDLFSATESDLADPTWIVCNPPYGERLRLPEPPVVYYGQMAAQMERLFRPSRVGLILPARFADRCQKSWPAAWAPSGDLTFSNGGIPVRALFFTRTP